jgi:spermidine synthase
VKPTKLIERVVTPLGEMALSLHDGDYAIRVSGVELMSSNNHQSEDDLGRMTCAPLRDHPAPRLLIGGLGLGYTLRAALDTLPRTAHVDVAELVPDVIRWNREVYGRLARHPLDDPRVHVIQGDVGAVIGNPAAPYDAIVLDVDNGPDGIAKGNDALYQRRGLQAAHAALVPGGLFAVWSSFESPTFTKWLLGVGFAVEIEKIRTWHGGGATHFIWLARR